MKWVMHIGLLALAGCLHSSGTSWQVRVDSPYTPFVIGANGVESGMILCTLFRDGHAQEFYISGRREELQSTKILSPSSVFRVHPFNWDSHEHSKFKQMSVQWEKLKLAD